MINFPNLDDLEKLKSIRDSTHLSIYASSIGSSDSNRIQLKNILHEYQNDLSKTAHKVSDIDKMFQPANKLLDDNSFWAKYTHGLVLFISPNLFKYYSQNIQTRYSKPRSKLRFKSATKNYEPKQVLLCFSTQPQKLLYV